MVYEALAGTAGLNVTFDSRFLDTLTPFKLDNVSVLDALDFLSLLTGTFWEVLNNKTIIVLEVNGYNQNSPRFIQQVCTEFERVKKSGSDVRFSLHTVDVSEILSERSYFVLDDHINAIGHSQVARLLVETIRRLRSKVPSRGTLKS